MKPSGYLNSPGYPNNYPLATDCVWEIETEPGSRVELTINDLDIESSTGCAFDFLQVNPFEMSHLGFYNIVIISGERWC